jgi:hypothetical protein
MPARRQLERDCEARLRGFGYTAEDHPQRLVDGCLVGKSPQPASSLAMMFASRLSNSRGENRVDASLYSETLPACWGLFVIRVIASRSDPIDERQPSGSYVSMSRPARIVLLFFIGGRPCGGDCEVQDRQDRGRSHLPSGERLQPSQSPNLVLVSSSTPSALVSLGCPSLAPNVARRLVLAQALIDDLA